MRGGLKSALKNSEMYAGRFLRRRKTGTSSMARKMRGTESKGKQLKAAAKFFPSILQLAMFFISPMFMTVMFSMTNLTLTGSQAASTHFVGFSNFTQIFNG